MKGGGYIQHLSWAPAAYRPHIPPRFAFLPGFSSLSAAVPPFLTAVWGQRLTRTGQELGAWRRSQCSSQAGLPDLLRDTLNALLLVKPQRCRRRCCRARRRWHKFSRAPPQRLRHGPPRRPTSRWSSTIGCRSIVPILPGLEALVNHRTHQVRGVKGRALPLRFPRCWHVHRARPEGGCLA